MVAQLRLVQETGEAEHAGANSPTPVARVFGHWVLMMGKNPKRAALGPTRRKVIEKALDLYDEETLLLAVEGCAGSAWHAGQNDRRTAYQDLELILRDEAHIERFAEEGELLRQRHERERQRVASEAAAAAKQGDPAVEAAAHARLLQLRAEFVARARGGR